MKHTLTKLLLILTLVLGIGPPALYAQTYAQTNAITTTGADCSTATNCTILTFNPVVQGSGSIWITGTWTGTMQFEVTSDAIPTSATNAQLNALTWVAVSAFPSSSTTGVTSATANGLWVFNAANFTALRVRASALASGTANVILRGSTASARGNGGGGAAGGVGIFTVATLPSGLGAAGTGTLATVKDGANASDCTVGLSTFAVTCIWTGAAWAFAGSSAGAPAFSAILTGTNTTTLTEGTGGTITTSGTGVINANQLNGGTAPASATIIGTNASKQPVTTALNSANIFVGSGSNLPVGVAVTGDVSLTNAGVATVTAANGGAFPASAKVVGTNGSSQPIAAALNSAHIYVGTAGNVPADVAVSGDVGITNAGVTTVTAVNGGAFPTSASVIGSDGSAKPVAATAHGIGVPQQCNDVSGSGSVQSCSTTVNFTPAAKDCIIYNTTTANTPGDVTVAVNGAAAAHIRKWLGSTTLAQGDLPANTPVHMCLDTAGFWEVATIGNAPAGSITASGPPVANQVPYFTSASNLAGITLTTSQQIYGTSTNPKAAATPCEDVRAHLATPYNTSPENEDLGAAISAAIGADPNNCADASGLNPGGGTLLATTTNPFAAFPDQPSIKLILPPWKIITSVPWTTPTGAIEIDGQTSGGAANISSEIAFCNKLNGCTVGSQTVPQFNAPGGVPQDCNGSGGTGCYPVGYIASTNGPFYTRPGSSSVAISGNGTSIHATGTLTTFTSNMIGGLIVSACLPAGTVGSACTAGSLTGGSGNYTLGYITAVTSATDLTIGRWQGGAVTGSVTNNYLIVYPNGAPVLLDGGLIGSSSGLSQSSFSHIIRNLRISTAGVRSAGCYLTPTGQESYELDNVRCSLGDGSSEGYTQDSFSSTFGFSWDNSYANSGVGHNVQAGTTTVSNNNGTALTAIAYIIKPFSEMTGSAVGYAGPTFQVLGSATASGAAPGHNFINCLVVDGGAQMFLSGLHCERAGTGGTPKFAVEIGPVLAHPVTGVHLSQINTVGNSGGLLHFNAGSYGSTADTICANDNAKILIQDDNESPTTIASALTANNGGQCTNYTQQNLGTFFAGPVSTTNHGVINFGVSAHTAPIQVGTTAGKPATCTVGDLYFANDATPGQNQFNCTATNIWTQNLNSGAAGANQALSNLSAVAVNSSLVPGADNTIDLGTAGLRWRSEYLGTVLAFTNGSGAADTGISRGAAGVIDIGTGLAGSTAGNLIANGIATGTATVPSFNGMTFPTITGPGTPSAGTLDLYADSTDLRFHDKNSAGTIGTTVVANSLAANNFVNAISAAGVVSGAQPTLGGITASFTSPVILTTNTVSISGVTGEQGTGAKLQLSTGTVNQDRLTKFGSAGDTINSDFTETGNLLANSVAATTSTIEGGADFSGNSAGGGLTLTSGGQTGAGGASSQTGPLFITTGTNAATNAASQSGSILITNGPSTNAGTLGLQGITEIAQQYALGGGTSTVNFLQCNNGTAMTVNDCGATPNNALGVAEKVNAHTVVVVTTGVAPIAASAAVTLGHTVCAGGTAGKVTDSGGTATCTNAQGATVGIVVAAAATTWTLGDGTTVAVSSTLPLIEMNPSAQVPASAGNPALSSVTGSAAQATLTEVGAGDQITFAGVETATLTYPYSFLNTSASANTSGALVVGTVGAGASQVPMIINENTVAGDFLDMCSGGAVTNGVVVCTNKKFAVSNTGTITTGSVPINNVISATGAITTIADGNNPLTINCALTSGATCVTNGETTASTSAGSVEQQVTTLTTSTSIAQQYTQGANGPANAAAPDIIKVSAAAAGGLAGASNAGSNGAAIELLTGAGSAGGATTGIGGNGGVLSATLGAGGNAGGTATNNGGNGAAFTITTGAGGNGGTGAATAGSGGAATFTMGAPGTNSATGTAGAVGLFSVTGNSPASTANATGVNSGNLFSVLGVAGGAISNTGASTAGKGSSPSITAGTGGAATGVGGNTTVGGAGGDVNISSGNGGAGSAGNNSGGNAGNVIVTPGAGGAKTGTGTAGLAGVFQVAGSTAGFTGLTQGSTNTTANTNIPANTIIDQAPTAVTAYTNTRPGTAAQGIQVGALSGSVITNGYSGDANHSATVSWSTATSIGSTSLCSTTFCPAGTYRVSAYIDVTTACTTTGSYVVNVIYTDDTTVSKTIVIPFAGLGFTTTFGPSAITSTLVPVATTDFGTGSFILRSTGAASINYSTTAGACGTGGPGVGKLYLVVEPIQ